MNDSLGGPMWTYDFLVQTLSPTYRRHHAVGHPRPSTMAEELQYGDIPIVDAFRQGVRSKSW